MPSSLVVIATLKTLMQQTSTNLVSTFNDKMYCDAILYPVLF